MRHRHHIVSAGYQRVFADGEQILLIDKTIRKAKLVGTRDAFVQLHFHSYVDYEGQRIDRLEDEWARLEDMVLPHIRRLIDGGPSVCRRDDVKVPAAIHFARSYSFAETHIRVAAETRANATKNIPKKPHLQESWLSEYGRPPQPSEIETYVEQKTEDLFGGRRMLVTSMAETYNKILDKLRPMFVQVVWPASQTTDFVMGDVPFVHFAGVQPGLRQRLAFDDATSLYMPLSPHLAAFFTSSNEQDRPVPSTLVQQLNLRIWQAAYRFVACHPLTDPSVALATTITTQKMLRPIRGIVESHNVVYFLTGPGSGRHRGSRRDPPAAGPGQPGHRLPPPDQAPRAAVNLGVLLAKHNEVGSARDAYQVAIDSHYPK